ncbi:hypothetical protein ACLB2K_038379 [Fragaria x ananassa]
MPPRGRGITCTWRFDTHSVVSRATKEGSGVIGVESQKALRNLGSGALRVRVFERLEEASTGLFNCLIRCTSVDSYAISNSSREVITCMRTPPVATSRSLLCRPSHLAFLAKSPMRTGSPKCTPPRLDVLCFAYDSTPTRSVTSPSQSEVYFFISTRCPFYMRTLSSSSHDLTGGPSLVNPKNLGSPV